MGAAALLAAVALTAVRAEVAVAGPATWFRAPLNSQVTPRAFHVAGYNDTAVFAVGGESDNAASASAAATTLTVYGNRAGFQSEWGVPQPGGGVAGAAAYAADRAAFAAARSETDASPSGWTTLAFGGLDAAGNAVATTARYSYVTRAWTALTPSGTPPSPRSLAAGVYLPRCSNASSTAAAGCFIVTGGVSAAGARLADTSVLYTGGLVPSSAGMSWFTPQAAAVDAPPARHSAAAAAGIDGHVMYLFGGDTALGVTNDLYALAPQGFASPLPPPDSNEMSNLAYGRPVLASSSDPNFGGNFSRATDGSTAGIVNQGPPSDPSFDLCTSTNIQPRDSNPWLRVDLGSPQRFDGVQFFGRTDCAVYNEGNVFGSTECATRNNGFQIAYGNSPASPTAAGNLVPNSPGYACDYSAAEAEPSSGVAFVHCPGAVARYVWIYLPGANRVLTVCELQVLAKQPWAWRQLSGGLSSLTNVALGKRARQSSLYFPNNGAQSVGSDANLAVDGLTSNDWFSGTCSHTDAAEAVSTFVVDLGDTFDVDHVVLFPVTTDEGALTLAQLTNGWSVSVGFSLSTPALNTLCATPASVAPAAGQSSVRISCPAKGRYLLIRRQVGVGGATSASIALCEAQVFATPIAGGPSPRAGAAATTFRGQLVVFGGFDGSGYHLNDVNFFDLTTLHWSAAQPMLATPPTPRAYTALAPVWPALTLFGGQFAQPAARLVLVGGASDTETLGDIWELQFPTCPPIDVTGVDQLSTQAFAAFTVWWPVCLNGYIAANAPGVPLVCGPKGQWVGANPPCHTGPPPAPASVTIAAAPALSWGVGAVDVSWAPVGGAVDYYDVLTTATGTFYAGFDAGTTSLAPGVWVDPMNAAEHNFIDGWLQESAGPGGYCLGAVNNCPRVVYPFTTSMPPGSSLPAFLNNVAFEAHVRLDEASAYPWYEMGIGLYSASKQVGGVTGALEFVATLYAGHQGGIPITAGCAYEPHSANWQTDQNCVYSTLTPIGSETDYYLKIENSVDTGFQWEAFFRASPLREWVTFGRRFTAAKAIGGALNPADLRVALWTMQDLNFYEPALGFARVMGDFDYVTIRPADCSLPGTRVQAPPATTQPLRLAGLTPNSNTSYVVSVAACTYAAGCSAYTGNTALGPDPGVFVPEALIAPPWESPVNLIEVARGRPTLSTVMLAGSSAAFAVDGNLAQTVANCAVVRGIADGSGFPQWAVDLGTTTDVKHITIYNANTNSEWLNDFQVYIGDTTAFDASRQCLPVPYFVNTAPYIANFDCPLSGRYVLVRQGRFDARLQLCEVQVFAANSCPPRSGVNADFVSTPAGCLTARRGDVCQLACAPGTFPVTGTTTATCQGEHWSSPPLVCQAPCATSFAVPPAVVAVRTALFYESFDGRLDTIQSTWSPLNDNRAGWGSYWAVEGEALQAMGSLSCLGDIAMIASSVQVRANRGPYQLHGLVSTAGRAGLIFHAVSGAAAASYRYVIDVHAAAVTFELVQADITTVLMRETGLPLVPNTVHELEVDVSGSVFTFYLDSNRVMVASDSALAAGFLGVYAETTAVFDEIYYKVDTARTCAGVTDGQTCELTCAPGYIPTGNLSLTCYNNPNGTSVPLPAFDSPVGSCVLPPPVFANYSAFVPEACASLPASVQYLCAQRNTEVGAPIGAQSAVEDQTLIFTILSGNAAVVGGMPYTDVFFFSGCSGQLMVRTPAALSATEHPSFLLKVQVSYADPANLQSAIGYVRVGVTAVPKPPTIAANQTLSLPENSAPGALIGPIAAAGGTAGAALVWTLLSDSGASGRFVMDAPTGIVRVAPNNTLPLNFEAVSVYLLSVQIALAATPAIYTTGSVVVQLTDVNEPPAYTQAIIAANDTALTQFYVFTPPLVPTSFADPDLPASGFAGTPVVTLLTPAAGATRCGITDASVVPSADGTLTGAQLFTMTTGAVQSLTLTALPTTAWTSMLPFYYNGLLARKHYEVCFSFYEVGATTCTLAAPCYASVHVAVLANLAADITAVGAYSNVTGAAVTALATVGGTFVDFNLAAGVTASGAITATYSNCGGSANLTLALFGCTTYTAKGCAFNATSGRVRCIAATGVGTAHLWVVMFGGATRLGTVALLTSYAAPTVTALAGNAAMPTDGTAVVLITGTNLGPYIAAAPTTTVRYGNALEYACSATAPTGAQNAQLVYSCRGAQGAGAGLPFRLWAGNQYVDSGTLSGVASAAFSYAPPTITSVALTTPGPNGSLPNQLSSAGGTSVTIVGTNFGPPTSPAPANTPLTLVVTYGRIGTEYTMASCLRGASPYTTATCVTAPGFGGGLVLRATVAGTPSVNASSVMLSYAGGPAIVGVTGPGVSGSPTAGGAFFEITATGMGPDLGPLQAGVISYGRAGNLRFKPACSVVSRSLVTAGQVTIDCYTVPGTGAGLALQLSIGGQVSPLFTVAGQTVTYAPPTVSGFTRFPATSSVNAFATAGGETVYIAGSNFGPADGIAPLVISYANTARGPADPALKLTPSGCFVRVTDTQIQCSIAPGAGTNLEWFVTVDGVNSAFPTTGYAPPLVNNITDVTDEGTGLSVPLASLNALNPNTVYSFALLGSSFGSPASGVNASLELITAVTYGPTGVEYAAALTAHIDDSRIVVTIGPAAGASLYFRVTVAGQTAASKGATFGFAAPRITALSVHHGPCANPVTAPTVVTITAQSPPLLDSSGASLVVTLDNGVASSPALAAVVPQTLADLQAATDGDGNVQFQVSLPSAWAGQGLVMRLGVLSAGGTLVVRSSLAAPAAVFSYDAPVITNAYASLATFAPNGTVVTPGTSLVLPCPWTSPDPNWTCDGSRGQLYILVLVGRNFGSSPRAAVGDPITRHLDVKPAASVNGTVTTASLWGEAGWVPTLGGAPGVGPNGGPAPAVVRYWSDNRIYAYTYAETGLVEVRLSNVDYAGALVNATSAPATPFTPNAPAISNVSGPLVNVSTTGGTAASPLSVLVYGLQTGQGQAISITVGNATCPLIKADGSPLTGSQDALFAPGGGATLYRCIIPPGQGTRNDIEVTLTTGGAFPVSTLAGAVAYAAPIVSYYRALQYLPAPATWLTYMTNGTSQPIVRAPTNGSSLQVWGTNLGTAPVLIFSAGPLEGRAALPPLSIVVAAAGMCGSPATQACWQFELPAGQGDGSYWSTAGYSLTLVAGDQDARQAAARFAYASPVVTSIAASPTGVAGCAVPTLGVCASGGAITLTLTGYNFGSSIKLFGESDALAGPRVAFYRSVTGEGWPTHFDCAGPVNRLSHFQITCTLPRGSGAGLTVEIGLAASFAAAWYGASTPGFSYDPPVITEAYAAVRAVPFPTAPCFNSTIEYYDNTANATLYNTSLVCPPPPSKLPAVDKSSVPPKAVSFNLVPPFGLNETADKVDWFTVTGGTPTGGVFPQLSGPSIANITANATSKTTFLTYVTVYGSNFGAAASSVHCPRMAWAYRTAKGMVPACNGAEGFLGEGEVATVISWSESKVVFVVPAGLGVKEVDLNVRGNSVRNGATLSVAPGVAAPPTFLYMAPTIRSASPRLLDTGGGTLVTLTGWGFGPASRATGVAGQAIANSLSFSVPLSAAPALPTTALRIQFSVNATSGPPCVSSSLLLNGVPSPYVSNRNFAACSPAAISGVTVAADGLSLTFVAPYGIGAMHNLSVVVIDGPLSDPAYTNSSDTRFTAISSNSFNVSYLPPIISGPLLPFALINGSYTGTTDPLTLLGFQFGSPLVDMDPRWSPEEKSIALTIGGVPCLAPRRSSLGSSGQSSITCIPDPDHSIVGTSNVTLVVAGQVASVDPSTSLARSVVVACGPNYYGRPGETCAPCNAPGHQLMAVTDNAVTGTPSIVCDGYAPNLSEDPTCFMGFLQLERLSELPPLTPAQLTVFASLSMGVLITSSTADLAAIFSFATGEATHRLPMLSTPVCPTHPYPAPRTGYFNLNTTMAGVCPPGLAVVGRDVCIAPCYDDMCGADNVCLPGYASLAPTFRCASCAPAGYSGAGSPAFYWRGGACVACPVGFQAIIVAYIVGVALVALTAYLAQKYSIHIGVASIGIDFFQVVGLMGTIKVGWHDKLTTLLHVLSASYANVEIVAPECLDPASTFVTKFTGIVLIPVALAVGLLIVHAVVLFSKVVVMGRRNEVMRHSHILLACAFVLMYYLYIYETRTLLAVFDCSPLVPSDGKRYMAAALFEECAWTPTPLLGGVWAKLLPPSIVGLIAYTAGYPLIVAVLLLLKREVIMEDQLLRAKGVGDDRLTNPHAYELRKSYAVLYSHFTPDTFYWVIVILMRKLLIALVPVLFNHNPSFQMAACLIVLLCAYGLHLRNLPYLSPANAEAVLRSHAESSFSSPIHARIRASIAGIETRGRKRTHRNVVDGTGRIDRSALLGFLTSWLFDPNTLEGALLFAAAIVALMGIMFQSEALQLGYYGDSREAVSDVAMAVIILGILYFVAVLAMEIFAVLGERAREAALLKRRRSSKSAGASPSPKLGSKSPSTRNALQAALGIADTAAAAAARKEGGLNTGQLDVALNPLFLNSPSSGGGGGAPISSAAAIDAVRSYKSAAPPLDMWRVIAAAFEEMHGQSTALAAELAAAKIALDKGAGDEGGRSMRASSSRTKSTFDPVASGALAAAGSDGRSPPATVLSAVNPAQRAQMLSGYARGGGAQTQRR